MSKYTAIYARTFFAEPGRIFQQTARLLNTAREKKLGNLRLFVDDGYAGDADYRPAFASMMDGICDYSIGAVIVEHIGRLERRPNQFRDTVRMIYEHGVRLIFVKEDVDVIPDDVLEDLDVFDNKSHFKNSCCEVMNPKIGKWGQLHCDYLEEERPGEHYRLFMNDILDQRLIEINRAAEKRMMELVSELQQNECVTEKLKAEDRKEWIIRMNSIRARASDIVKEELIFS